MSKSSDDAFVLGIAALAFGAGLIYTSIKNFRKGRKIQDTARIEIGSAPQGLVEVEGYAWPAINTMAAVCGRSVVYYHYKVQQYVKRGKNSHWETKHEFNFNNPFYVIDSSGVCLVHPDKKCMEVREYTTRLSGYGEHVEALTQLARPAVGGFLGSLFSRSYRLLENKILVGSPVYVCGEMRSRGASPVKIKGAYKKFLERVKLTRTNPVFRLQKFDKNRDGKITEQEMLEGLSDTSKEIPGATEEAIALAGVISNSETHSLILGDCHQEELLKRVSSYNYLKMLGGVLLIGIGIFILQNTLRI